jgi:predicted nucleic acid-binding protein
MLQRLDLGQQHIVREAAQAPMGLHHCGKCNHLELLTALFSRLHLPRPVVEEALVGGAWPEIPFLRKFIKRANVHESIQNEWVKDLRVELHEGEIQTMTLAKKRDALVLMDEAYGTRIAADKKLALALCQAGELGTG